MQFFYPGLADPNALNQAVAAFQACQQIGMPECQVKINVYTVQCGPQKLNNEGMYMVQNRSHTYLTNI